ncbi:hypothetical protein QEN19_003141 [Hanseniaspora menglaensis]
MEALRLTGQVSDDQKKYKRYRLLLKQCDHTLSNILKKLSSKTIVQDCFPPETFAGYYPDIRDLLIEISDLLRNLVKSELADTMIADKLEDRLNGLDEVIAITISKQQQLKSIVETEGWESKNVKSILDEELVNFQEVTTEEIIRFHEYCNMNNLLGELVKRREFLDEVVAKLENDIVLGVQQINTKNDKMKHMVFENVSKFVDQSGQSSHNVDQMRKSLIEFVQNELNFEEQDAEMAM